MRRLIAIVVAVLATTALSPPARGADVIGIADQSAGMFANPFYRALDVKVSRLIVSYDAVMSGTFEVNDIDNWVRAARAAKVEPLISLSHARGCYDGKGIVKKKVCRLPSVKRYQRAFTAFRRRYPDLRVYSPWNEINHRSQPTWKNPKRAAEFYNVVRKRCRGCRIVAADVLDQPGMATYLRRFRRHADGNPRLWGLHNYQDTNNYTTRGTRTMLRAVKGQIWITETGGIVKFGERRPFNPQRAAKATRFMLKLARTSPRITRLYIYNWTGVPLSARFDAGLTTPEGLPRPAYWVVAARLRKPGGNPDPAPVPMPPPPPRPTPSDPPAPPPPSPTPTPTPGPTPTPTPTPIPTPQPPGGPTPTPTPSPTPTPAPTPTPTPTPNPCDFVSLC